MGDILLGTCGYSYKEWEGVFYPEQFKKNKLSYYSRYFSTVEIDSTFYAYPKKGTIQGCARYTPDDFTFTAKLPKLITHEKKLELSKGVKADLYRFLDLMKPLLNQDKLGALLIQLPPSASYEKSSTDLWRFMEELPTDVRFAVEFRNKSWLRGETWDLLKRYGVANTIVDEPLLPPDPIVTSDFSIIRWHGHGNRPWYNYRYSASELESWAPKVKEVASKTKRVFGSYNNHFRGFAVENALKMMELLRQANSEQQALRRKVTNYIERSQSAPQQATLPTYEAAKP